MSAPKLPFIVFPPSVASSSASPPAPRFVGRLAPAPPLARCAELPLPAEAAFAGADGTALAYEEVSAGPAAPVLLYFNGAADNGSWFLRAARALRDHGCTTLLADRRGSGRNRGARPGHAPSADALLRDVRALRASRGDAEMHFVGFSWGARLALAAALDRPERVKSLVLVAPALRGQSHPSLLARASSLLGGLCGAGRIRVPLDLAATDFSRDPDLVRFVREDPLRLDSVTSRFLAVTRQLERLVEEGLEKIRVPVLLFLAGLDPVVDNRAVMDALRPIAKLRVRVFPTALHALPLVEKRALARETAEFVHATK